MSRHRAVKNLDLDDELDDGGFDSSEDYYEDMTSEQQAQMVAAVQQVEQILGPSTQSGVSAKEIRDSLWDSYFDVEGTVAYFLDVVHKREVKKKKEQGKPSPASPLPDGDDQAGNEQMQGIEATERGIENLSINPAPRSKLSSKIAALKLAKSSSSPSLPSKSTSSSPSTPPATTTTTTTTTTKPLSKLQQKMLAKQQASAARPAASSTSAPSSRPAPAPSSPPPTTESSTTAVTLPPIFTNATPSGRALSATPSPFAASLVPQTPSSTSRGGIELARLLAKSVTAVGGPTSLPAGQDAWGLSPDDRVMEARKGTALNARAGRGGREEEEVRGKEERNRMNGRERGTGRNTSPPLPIVCKQRQAKQQQQQQAQQKPSPASGSTTTTTSAAPKISLKKAGSSTTTTLSAGSGPTASSYAPPRVDQLKNDMEALGLEQSKSLHQVELDDKAARAEQARLEHEAERAVLASKDKILAEVRDRERAAGAKPTLSLVVIGHVDAGKSTLMGRVLHELGETEDRVVEGYQRQSAKMGKASFAYAWTFDALQEERERGVTIDVAIDSFETKSRKFTLIDAPGHRDFIPNMISGAAQADVAILVVDGSSGAFEKGFEGGGQTREHAVLVRSLGVQQLVVAVNKLDAVDWSEKRFEAIKLQLWPFLTTQTGFTPQNIHFVPVGAMSGENLVESRNPTLQSWWNAPGLTLVDTLDLLQIPTRSLESPLRIPVSNVFKGQSATASGLAVSGRVESGIVQVGERLAALPGDETGVVRAIEVDGELVPYAIAGASATVFLSGIDANQLAVGTVLCPPGPALAVPVVSQFVAQIIVFEPKYPITAGYAVELFHHSRDVPASIARLDATLDRATGQVVKSKPRLLAKHSSAQVLVQLRPAPGIRSSAIPLEPFAVNKSMGRVLFRRGGETVAAGIVLKCL
ncbi:hypothetical protein JCM11491_005520 [Sporobolomyces phaffii]